jgi:hypothetical protein
VRDQLIAPAERQEKAQTWDQVVQYIRHKESRVREEIQHIAGDEFRLVATVPEMEFLNAILVEVSGHKLESSQTRVFVWFSTLIFSVL